VLVITPINLVVQLVVRTTALQHTASHSITNNFITVLIIVTSSISYEDGLKNYSTASRT